MSSYKAIAGVSSTLVNLLKDRMTEASAFTVAPPDVSVDNVSGRRLNLYLYHVAENGILKNQEIPGEGYPGAYGHPPLSLNLHYIFTAFGSSDTGADADLEAQLILGDAMRVLHDFAVITPDLVQEKTLGNPRILDASLLGEFEQVKTTLQPKSLEEISKIWTALPKVNFRRSVTYEISVVQIESQAARVLALPVRENRVYALPMQSPQILEIFRNPPIAGVKIAAAQEGETLHLAGFNFGHPFTRVDMDGVAGNVAALTDDAIEVVIPPGQLFAGLHSIQVVQDVMLTVVDKKPAVQRGGFRSNAAGFLLIPAVSNPTPASAGPGQTITVTVQPAVKPTQEKVLLLGDYSVPALPVSFDSPPSSTIKFQLPQAPDLVIPPGNYLLRVRIDGVESRLNIDLNPPSPTYLQYVGPLYTVT
ncbi:MAG TPA: DUF4255 domain-containing protein [Candidatus Acidoferrales bacterium]|nr:DUF4255 domain-containing protein [Candidatus Acidoferrales bacterium]